MAKLVVERSDMPEDEKTRRLASIDAEGFAAFVLAIVRATDNLRQPIGGRQRG